MVRKRPFLAQKQPIRLNERVMERDRNIDRDRDIDREKGTNREGEREKLESE